jgi:hypothetical protein
MNVGAVVILDLYTVTIPSSSWSARDVCRGLEAKRVRTVWFIEHVDIKVASTVVVLDTTKDYALTSDCWVIRVYF